MKRKICIVLVLCILSVSCGVPAYAQDKPKPSELYSLSAAVLDGENGRVLFEKDGSDVRAMASTTKIMTCILALENGDMDSYVTVSGYAAKMPDVQLGICAGEQYLLSDLMYSMMLESHNDSAVAIAEHISGSVESFAKLMNAKAAELGLTDTYFITPNGLDAQNESGTHGTTAIELAKIMQYCVSRSPCRDAFMQICQTSSKTFSDYTGKRRFTVNNKNRLLTMMDGVLAGKTGFTANAGYCYVAAVNKDGHLFIVALLGCGWPGNKEYKWKDTKRLLAYASENFTDTVVLSENEPLAPCYVFDGEQDVPLAVEYHETVHLLLSDEDNVEVKTTYYEVCAPIEQGTVVGDICILINGELYRKVNILSGERIEKKYFPYYLKKVLHLFL